MNHTKNFSWDRQVLRRSGHPFVEWCYIGTFGAPEVSVGILRDGSWVVATADGLVDFKNNVALTFVFPILNLQVNSFQERLVDIQKRTKDLVCEEFPLKRIVIQAIVSGGYWAEKAFSWLPEIKFSQVEKNTIIEGLIAIEKGKKIYGQKLRHEARRQRCKIETRKKSYGTERQAE